MPGESLNFQGRQLREKNKPNTKFKNNNREVCVCVFSKISFHHTIIIENLLDGGVTLRTKLLFSPMN